MAATTKKKKTRNLLPGDIPLSELGAGKEGREKRQAKTNKRARTPGRPDKPLKRGRKPPPVPKGKTKEEIAEMDPDDPRFKHPDGRKRIPLKEREKRGMKSVARADMQKRANARRGKIRKYEAEVVAAQQEASLNGKPVQGTQLEVIEANLIVRGDLTLDEWDDEELIRGYRKNRDGRFGPPPKWVPREVQQEAMRRVLARGNKKFREAYLKSVDRLVELAENAGSEKVMMEAIKEIQYRVMGKIPDRVLIQEDDPFADFLADTFLPLDETEPLEVWGEKKAAPIETKAGGAREAGSAAGPNARKRARRREKKERAAPGASSPPRDPRLKVEDDVW